MNTIPILFLMCSILFCGAARGQQTSISNFGPADSYNPTNGFLLNYSASSRNKIAVSFVPTVDMYLGTVRLPIQSVQGNFVVDVSIVPLAPGGSPLETFSFGSSEMHVDNESVNPPLVANSILHPKLDAGTTYWITAALRSNFGLQVYARWKTNSVGAAGLVSSLASGFGGSSEWKTTTGTTPTFEVMGAMESPFTIALGAGNKVIVSWTDASFSLLSSPNVDGPYSTIPGATSPFTNSIASQPTFFRLLSN
jgi:hypothetical protein